MFVSSVYRFIKVTKVSYHFPASGTESYCRNTSRFEVSANRIQQWYISKHSSALPREKTANSVQKTASPWRSCKNRTRSNWSAFVAFCAVEPRFFIAGRQNSRSRTESCRVRTRLQMYVHRSQAKAHSTNRGFQIQNNYLISMFWKFSNVFFSFNHEMPCLRQKKLQSHQQSIGRPMMDHSRYSSEKRQDFIISINLQLSETIFLY